MTTPPGGRGSRTRRPARGAASRAGRAPTARRRRRRGEVRGGRLARAQDRCMVSRAGERVCIASLSTQTKGPRSRAGTLRAFEQWASDHGPGVAATDELAEPLARGAGCHLLGGGDLTAGAVVVRRPLDLAEDPDR